MINFLIKFVDRSEAGGPAFSWDDFHQMLWGLTQSSIMDTSFSVYRSICTFNKILTNTLNRRYSTHIHSQYPEWIYCR